MTYLRNIFAYLQGFDRFISIKRIALDSFDVSANFYICYLALICVKNIDVFPCRTVIYKSSAVFRSLAEYVQLKRVLAVRNKLPENVYVAVSSGFHSVGRKVAAVCESIYRYSPHKCMRASLRAHKYSVYFRF